MSMKVSTGAAAVCTCFLTATLTALPSAHAQERRIRPAPAFTAATLTAPPTSGWLTNGGSLYNQRFSPLTLLNPGPVLNGNLRPGDNLFSVSIVAVDAATGEDRWHFQQVHHDIWDYDSPNPIILFDAPYDGVMRRGLAQAAKTGWVLSTRPCHRFTTSQASSSRRSARRNGPEHDDVSPLVRN